MLKARRVAVRNVRRDVMGDVKELLKEKLISQDEERKAEGDIQKLTDKHIADIEQLLTAKEKRGHAGLTKLPRHVAIIMDGNGRWAKANGVPACCRTSGGPSSRRRMAIQECAPPGGSRP